MNEFGGLWTEIKMEIVKKYAIAYLQIMKSFKEQFNWKLLYFDGFAGSGQIDKGGELITDGMSSIIMQIDKPISFDFYYFVELNENNALNLEQILFKKFPKKVAITHVVSDDCNKKLKDLAEFMRGKGRQYKVLAFIDPYGMSLNWSSIEALKDLSVDLWILIPSGIGANRLLTKSGVISDSWYLKLEKFLGINKDEIDKVFYSKDPQLDIFNEETVVKDIDAIEKVHEIYKLKLLTVFKFVSEPFILKNSTNSVMYHFLFASNNKNATNIANEIIEPYKM